MTYDDVTIAPILRQWRSMTSLLRLYCANDVWRRHYCVLYCANDVWRRHYCAYTAPMTFDDVTIAPILRQWRSMTSLLRTILRQWRLTTSLLLLLLLLSIYCESKLRSNLHVVIQGRRLLKEKQFEYARNVTDGIYCASGEWGVWWGGVGVRIHLSLPFANSTEVQRSLSVILLYAMPPCIDIELSQYN